MVPRPSSPKEVVLRPSSLYHRLGTIALLAALRWRRAAARRYARADFVRPAGKSPRKIWACSLPRRSEYFRSNHLSTPTGTLLRFPRATQSCPLACHTRAGPRPTPLRALTDHFAFASRCAQRLLFDEHLLGLLLPRRRACGAYSMAAWRRPSLELYACSMHAEKCGVLSAATCVRWVCICACTMCRASRGRSDAVPFALWR